MLGRRNKKRQGSVSSVDVLSNNQQHDNANQQPPATSTSTRAFNLFVERAKGALGAGTKSRTSSDEGSRQARESTSAMTTSTASSLPTSTSTRSFFGSKPSTAASQPSTAMASAEPERIAFPTSSSMYDLSTAAKAQQSNQQQQQQQPSGGFLKRATAMSNPLKPAWLSASSSDQDTPAPTTSRQATIATSSSSPLLSSPDPHRSLASRSRENLAGLKRSNNKSTEDLSTRRHSRMFLDGIPPVPTLARTSTDDLSPADAFANRSRAPSSSSTSTSGGRRTRTTSLAPSAALDSYPSPSLTTSATSTSTSRSPSLSSRDLAGQREGPTGDDSLAPTLPSGPPSASPTLTAGSAGDRDWKRDSQTIWFQGLLMRKGDYVPVTPKRSPASPSATTSLTSTSSYFNAPQARPSKSDHDLQRGWKPYSAFLKGSKLYLHKLPGDLATTAKHVFPTTVIDDMAFASKSPMLTSPLASPSLGEEGARRRQRTFWGAGTDSHPALTCSNESPVTIRGGSLEALVHELIFATTVPTDASSSDDNDAFNTFRRTLLLCWPHLPIRAGAFVGELGRYARLALDAARDAQTRESSASTEMTLRSAARLRDLINIVSTSYPQDLRQIERGRATMSELGRALSDLASTVDHLLPPSESGAATASSTVRGAYDIVCKDQVTSRPLTEWQPVTTPATPKSTASSPSKSRKRQTTESSAITMPVTQLVQIPPAELAAQIHLFHVDRLAAISGNACASRHMLRTASLLLASEALNKTTITSMFSFTASSPHFLTRLVLDTILSSPGRTPTTPSTVEVRAATISHWINVGEELRRRGDMAGWAAVAMALCCRAVARLDETWRAVQSRHVKVIRTTWAVMLSEINFVDGDSLSASYIAPMATLVMDGTGVPFLGSILRETVNELGRATSKMSSSEGTIDLLPLYNLKNQLEQLERAWNQRNPVASIDDIVKPDQQVQYLLQTCSRLPSPQNLPQLSSYLASSFEVEPRFPAQHFNLSLRRQVTGDINPILPLLMVEPVPHVALMDYKRLRSGESMTTLSDAGSAAVRSRREQQAAGLRRRNSYPPTPAPLMERLGTFAKLRKEILSSNRTTTVAGATTETLLHFAEGDIVFRIVASTAADVSRRTSGAFVRTPSWIESKTGAGTRSKSSRASVGSSLAPLSRSSSRRDSSPGSGEGLEKSTRQAIAASDEPVHVVVQAATVEALIDTIVLGTGIYRTPSTDADGQPSLSGRRPLTLDRAELMDTFFATYRSFSSSLAVLDMLRKRFLGATNAASELVGLTSDRPFPSWSLSPPSQPVTTLTADAAAEQAEAATRIRLDILQVVQFWVSKFVSDFLDNDDLWSSTLTMLDYASTSGEVVELKTVASDIKRDLLLKALCPFEARTDDEEVVGQTSGLGFDQQTADALVDTLDAMSRRTIAKVSSRDMHRWIDALEVTSMSDPSAWYAIRSSTSKPDEDDIVISDPYSHMLALLSDTSLSKHLPQSLRQALDKHCLIRRWILAHLVDPNISSRDRQLRMLKTLELVEICRSRMANVAFGGQADSVETLHDPTIASFVERAIVSAIVSPESRLFASAWQGVASARGASIPDTVLSIIRREPVSTEATCAVDLAWLVERLIELVTQIDSLSDGMSINFAKRRWVRNMINNACALNNDTGLSGGEATWTSLETGLRDWGNWTTRALKDAASSESIKSTKLYKPFARLVTQQQDKLKRDKLAREQISKGQKLEQQTRLQKEKEVAKAMDKSVNVRARRMTSLFNFGRPTTPSVGQTSLSSTSSSQQSIQPQLSAHALQALRDFVPNSKPYLVLALSGVDAHALKDSPRSFVFELTTEDGQRSLFQAPTRHELESWIDHFKRSGSQIAFRRATFLAQTALAEESEDQGSVGVAAVTTSKSPVLRTVPMPKGAVFATPLWDLVQREGREVPLLVEEALAAIERRGLSEVGIYRISGENRVIQELRDSIDRGIDPAPMFATTDVHNVTGLLKLYLRELPEPVIPFELYSEFISSNSIQDYDERHYAVRDLVWRMPQPNFVLLRSLMEHLDKVTDNEGVNAMHAANLSIIFAPTLLKPPPGPTAFGLSMTNLGQAANAIKAIILQQHWIFADFSAEEVEAATQTTTIEAEASSSLADADTLVTTTESEQAESQGNFIGLGLADDVTRHQIDLHEPSSLSLDSRDQDQTPITEAFNIPGVGTVTGTVPTVDVFNPSSAPQSTSLSLEPSTLIDSGSQRPRSIGSSSSAQEYPTTPRTNIVELEGQQVRGHDDANLCGGYLDQLQLPSPISTSLFASKRSPKSTTSGTP
ncbi:rho GTPase-activating protein [Microbotryomycetes sp. JL221]|nr:rho GTPase-activating protein [Microbotryomycetes sp. JL221]